MVACGKCHEPHNIEPNSGQGHDLVREQVRWPTAATPVAWPTGGSNAFARGASPYDGVCEVCHTATDYHRNGMSGDHEHNMAQDCTACHPHGKGFAPQGCTGCHDKPQDNGDGVPVGGRRKIAGAGSDFTRKSHHVAGAVADSDCIVCHAMGSHKSGVVRLKDPDAGDAVVYVYNAADLSDDPIEVGTRNSSWSTDEGKHGTWKYSEMKRNMTLEAWVYPTVSDGERKVLAKHTYSSGGYALVLKQIGGRLRVGLLANVNGGVKGGWGVDCNGLRGAYSTVGIPLKVDARRRDLGLARTGQEPLGRVGRPGQDMGGRRGRDRLLR